MHLFYLFKSVLIHTFVLDKCLLPKVKGPCNGYYTSYYYDSDRNSCSQFIYGGCLGNNNRFETVEECQKECVRDESLREL